jgi:hypothetical protein
MKSTLTIKDLSVSKELDRKAMSAVRGGYSDQAIAVDQKNFQTALVGMNIANGSVLGGPTNIQADSVVHQDADNYSYNDNYKALFGPVPFD